MSAQDIQLVEETLNGLMLSDNTLRRTAEAKLEELMQNKSGLIFCLSSILLNSTNAAAKLYAAVVTRKVLEIKETDIVNPVWKSMEVSVKDLVRSNALNALINTSERNLKFKICDSVAQICENTYENEEEWNDLLAFLSNTFSLELNDQSILNIESALYILSHIFGYAYEALTKGIDLFVKAFSTYFTSSSLDLRTKTVQALSEILSIVRKKDSKKFKDFMFYVLETTLKCMENCPKEENNLKLCLTALTDLASSEPNILRKHFGDLFILMGKITEKKDFSDENMRELGFEIIMTMVEKKETLISKDPEKIKVFIEAIYKYALEMEDEITDEWMSPKTESYFDEEFIPEEKVGTALSLIDRLTAALGNKLILGYLSDIVLQLLNNQNDWKYKYIGYMTISQMVEYVDDIANIDNILPSIFVDTENTNPKIRYACLHCISQISDHLNPAFQNNYHEKVFSAALNRLQVDNVLRVRLQACDALQTYIEFCSDQVATTHCQVALDSLFSVFLKDDVEVPVSLRESLLNVVAELVTACEKNFAPYAEKCLNILLNYFSTILSYKTHKSLHGILLDTITCIGPKCEEAYYKFLPDLVHAMVEIQNNIPNSTDPITSYLHNAWERVIPIIKDHYKESAPKIIESVLKLVSNPPTMSVSSQPEKKFDIQELLGSINAEGQNVQIQKNKVSMTTSETEDFAGCIELLNIVVETFSELYLPYVEITQKTIFPLLLYEVNDSVRAEASNVLPQLIQIISTTGVESVHAAAKLYLSELVQALEKETDNSVIATFLDNIASIVEKAGLFLTTPEINILFSKLLQVFDKVEQNRLTLLNQKDKVEEEIIKEEEGGVDKINSDDEGDDDEDDIVGEIEKDIEEIEEVLVSIADVMGTLMNTHKELTLEIVNKLITDLLPKYFLEKASNFEKKMGLFILDDMLEFLGQTLLQGIWSDIAKIIISYADSKQTELRQAACYGIGEFSKHTVKDYNLYSNDCLNGLSKALDINADGEDDEEWGHARDNGIAALGKIIKFQGSFVDVNVLIPKWVELLPLRYDIKEAANQHEFLCEILLNKADLVTGQNNANLPKIIRILAKIYETKFSNEELDKTINNIFTNIKNTQALHEFVKLAKQGAENKILKKLETHFPGL